MSISRTIQKFRIGEQPKEFVFWQSRSYEERLRALEDIRREYNGWKYNDLANLKKNKAATGRTQDLADLEHLSGDDE